MIWESTSLDSRGRSSVADGGEPRAPLGSAWTEKNWTRSTSGQLAGQSWKPETRSVTVSAASFIETAATFSFVHSPRRLLGCISV